MDFVLQKIDTQSQARAGLLTTDHGEIETPIFMPVGTQGTVKAIYFSELEQDIRAPIILGNTYHLYLNPGEKILKSAGGLHKFIGWNRPILTDSGGFQIFSLPDIKKLTLHGVEFRSYRDGSKHFFTPEKAVDIQRSIGGDIIMALDECIPGDTKYKDAAMALNHTENWLNRSLIRFHETTSKYGYSQAFFPIVQGCIYPDLRKRAAENIASKNAEGNAIGGLAVGESTEKMLEMLEIVNTILPINKPRYLMGVGTPVNLLDGIERGVDLFDCVIPTRNGRNGQLFTKEGLINIKNKKWATDFSFLEFCGASEIDEMYTKAYLHHLFSVNALLAFQIASRHNLSFYLWLVKEARKHILFGNFSAWKKKILCHLSVRL